METSIVEGQIPQCWVMNQVISLIFRTRKLMLREELTTGVLACVGHKSTKRDVT